MSLRVVVLLTAAACLGPAAHAARQAGEPFRTGFNLFSKQQDVELGQEAAQEVRKKYKEVNSPFLQAYVRRIGERLAATPNAKASGFPFTFTVLENKQVNAFALPGGPIFILSGLLQNVDTEGQLAAVMAHEMSHVILRHGTHETSKAGLWNIPVMLAGAATGKDSILTRLTAAGVNLPIMKFSRDAESEADALGAHLMADAGYDPTEMAQFFNKLQSIGSQGNSKFAQILSDHPNPGNRERAIEEEARYIHGKNYGYRTGEFERAKEEVARLPK